MSTDNKTLADVQPGGRVRLGDQTERARFEAWWLSIGRTKNDLRKMEGEYIYEDSRYAWFGWKAALTPPEGFVLVEKSKLADSERLDFLDAMNVALNSHYGTNYGWRLILSPQITRLMCGQQHQGFVGDIDLNDQNGGRTGFLGCREAIDAARQPVGEPVARLIEAVEGECDGLVISTDTASSILAHVFPTGQIATAYMVDGRIEQGLFFDRAAAETMAAMNAGEVVPLFRSPAQAVDLGEMPDGWRLSKKTTCYQLSHGNDIIGNLVGPDAEENAAIIARVLDSQAVGK